MAFTAEQKKAINDQGRDILVSASAGSGKTTVLVQRVLKEIKAGRSIDQLLIVTFTKAAAEEMKTRIKTELSQAIKKDHSKQAYLRTQLNQIDTANISTIDAFCLEVIHRFYYAIDLDPSFSILTDETQAALLRERALKEIEREKLDAQDKDFIAFYDNFAGDRDADAARNLLLDLYDFAMAKPDYQAWLKKLPEAYDFSEEITRSHFWQAEIKPYLLQIFTTLKRKIQRLLESDYFQAKELKKAQQALTAFAAKLNCFIKQLKADCDYDQLRSSLSQCIFTIRFQKSKKWDSDLLAFYQQIQDLKDSAKKQVFTSYAAFFASNEEEQLQALKKGKRLVQAIVQTEIALIDRFNSLKREENLLDYSDMEQLAYKILSQDTSNSQLARDFYQNKFKEILVDEYQDINPLQERILQLLKKKGQNTIFMVGDVKQSIYGFRQAEPSLFLQKYHDFGRTDHEDQERILLSSNFRSTRPVTQIVNQLFAPILSKDFGGIDYQREGRLVFGADYYPHHLPQATEFIFHEKSNHEQSEDEDGIDFSEIEMVIDRIKHFQKENLQIFDASLGKKRPLRYSDIAILTRSRSNNLDIMQAFAKQDLPLFVTDAEDYFQTFELTIVMNYLKIIDNPDQDIPLVTVLRSPLFNFNERDLAKIRIHSKTTSFYNAVLSYVSVSDELSKRVKRFLNQLAALRRYASTHRISALIWSIYEKTNLLEIMTALPNGQQRRVNLESLYERASSYESAGFKGLYQFINFIERMRKSQKDLAQPLLTKEAGNAVRLMTIHGSKGLEFPIVFFVGLEHHYQMRDLNADYIINKDSLGLTIKEKSYRLDTLVKALGNVKKKRQLLEEEARILYVALTRAKQKLILVADIPHLAKKEQNWHRQLAGRQELTLSDKLAATSPLSFLGPGLKLDQHVSQEMTAITAAVDQTESLLFIAYRDHPRQTSKTNQETKKEQKEYSLLNKTTEKLYDFRYPFADASQTTAYQAVSEIKKAFNDPIDTDLENAHLIASTNRYLQPIDTRPNFLFASKFTGAEIGTATHLVLQYYDYRSRGDDQALQTEIENLVRRKKLNPDIVSSLNQKSINWFVHSDFARVFWRQPEHLHREVDFSSLIAASRLFKNFSDPNAKILVHGTIDGYYITSTGIILFDYKTDHVDQKHEDLAIQKIKQKYTGQLRLYEQALDAFSEQKVKSKYLILLDDQKIVKVD